MNPLRFFRYNITSRGLSRFCISTSCTPPGVNVKDSPLCSLPKNVRLSTGSPETHEYTCLKKGILKIAEVIRHLPSSPIFPGSRRSTGLKAKTAYGSISCGLNANMSALFWFAWRIRSSSSSITVFRPKYFSACCIIQSPIRYPKAPGKSAGSTKDNVVTPTITIRCHLSARKIVYSISNRTIPFHPSQRVTAMVGRRPESCGVS
mmetsp:Transcript_10386/g.23106  ORF Transcript_10386/g.23106 Transcript_10386/m.23106 type:complete len:205 (+) Transcript_10386:1148-1762(+)